MRGSMAIPLYQVPRVKGDRGADIARMMAGSSVMILFGAIRAGEPEYVFNEHAEG